MSENFNASWAHVKGDTWCMLTENAYIPVYVLEDNRAIMLDSGWQDDLPDILRLFEEKNLHRITAEMTALAETFGVEPRKLLSHVLEYRLHWD